MLTDNAEIRNESIRELTGEEIAAVAGGVMRRGGGSPLAGIIDFLSDTIFRGTLLDRLVDHFEQNQLRQK